MSLVRADRNMNRAENNTFFEENLLKAVVDFRLELQWNGLDQWKFMCKNFLIYILLRLYGKSIENALHRSSPSTLSEFELYFHQRIGDGHMQVMHLILVFVKKKNHVHIHN